MSSSAVRGKIFVRVIDEAENENNVLGKYFLNENLMEGFKFYKKHVHVWQKGCEIFLVKSALVI